MWQAEEPGDKIPRASFTSLQLHRSTWPMAARPASPPGDLSARCVCTGMSRGKGAGCACRNDTQVLPCVRAYAPTLSNALTHTCMHTCVRTCPSPSLSQAVFRRDTRAAHHRAQPLSPVPAVSRALVAVVRQRGTWAANGDKSSSPGATNRDEQ